ncbi:FG-GAP repeat domain-containing protein [Fusarium denticulatum]|uniref:FG-GAP repeat domain-containing protein n=1 Tax=Fusarium denticulatum TaxID=48507 RepID=A0A8H5T8Y5_9HYPO|nr:FG-GAP repeat domain-containing protein [Fusarium denticulatum]
MLRQFAKIQIWGLADWSDNYAWYAMATWFSQWYGIPQCATLTLESDWLDDHFDDDSDTGDDDNLIDPDYEEICALEAIAFSAGEYTPNSWLKGKDLRILPLGDSITYGYKSSDGNGYPNTLRDLLVKAGNTVDMIGSVRAGSMNDNDNKGHSDYIISQIAEYNSAYKERLNAVLLHAGTNDMGQATGSYTAPERLDRHPLPHFPTRL